MRKSRHPKRRHKNKPGSSLFNVSKELERIDALIEAGDLPEALEGLKQLAVRAPHRVEIFETIFLVAMQLQDNLELLEAAIRLNELQPFVPAHQFNLYGVYKQNLFPALALQTGRHFISRWPDLELGNDIRKEVDELAGLLQNDAAKYPFPQNAWLEHLVLHEQVQVALARNRYDEAQQLATQLIALAPQFVSSYNNRSLAYWAEGEAEAAIADAQRVLDIEPNNVHALSNLTRFLRLTNRLTEAREVAERLKTAESLSLDAWIKKAEALSYLPDDSAVLQIAEYAEKAGALVGKYVDPLLLHLLGVAAARLGDEKKARGLWQEAIKRAPSLARVQAQLDDLDKPRGERDGPWPFTLMDWISPRQFEEFKHTLESTGRLSNDKPAKKAAQRILESHPHVAALVPVLLERGDPHAREFAWRLAQIAETPELLGALKDFVLSPNGPDKLRQEVLTSLQQAGIFRKSQTFRLWVGGEQREIMLANYKIDDVPYEKLSPKVRQLHQAGLEALQRKELDRAEELFSQALAMVPDSASIQYNLAALQVERGNVVKARELLQTLAARHPQYAFAHCQLALLALANDRKEEARKLLDAVSSYDHFHGAEFVSFCKAQILYYIVAEPDREAAEHWLNMWEDLVPDDPKLDTMRPLVKNSLLARLHAKSMLAPLRE